MKPIINDATKKLVLGSFPGEESIKENKYYNSSRNSFWKILDVQEEDYNGQIKFILNKNIGLWDIFNNVERKGSLDKDIDLKSKNTKFNDLKTFLKENKQIDEVFINGKGVYKKFLKKYLEEEGLKVKNGELIIDEKKIKINICYSTSNANSKKTINEKKHDWKKIFN